MGMDSTESIQRIWISWSLNIYHFEIYHRGITTNLNQWRGNWTPYIFWGHWTPSCIEPPPALIVVDPPYGLHFGSVSGGMPQRTRLIKVLCTGQMDTNRKRVYCEIQIDNLESRRVKCMDLAAPTPSTLSRGMETGMRAPTWMYRWGVDAFWDFRHRASCKKRIVISSARVFPNVCIEGAPHQEWSFPSMQTGYCCCAFWPEPWPTGLQKVSATKSRTIFPKGLNPHFILGSCYAPRLSMH